MRDAPSLHVLLVVYIDLELALMVVTTCRRTCRLHLPGIMKTSLQAAAIGVKLPQFPPAPHAVHSVSRGYLVAQQNVQPSNVSLSQKLTERVEHWFGVSVAMCTMTSLIPRHKKRTHIIIYQLYFILKLIIIVYM